MNEFYERHLLYQYFILRIIILYINYMNCEYHIEKTFSHICLSEGCKKRLVCDLC